MVAVPFWGSCRRSEMPEVGDIAPDFVLPSTERDISLRDLLAEGKKVVLAF